MNEQRSSRAYCLRLALLAGSAARSEVTNELQASRHARGKPGNIRRRAAGAARAYAPGSARVTLRSWSLLQLGHAERIVAGLSHVVALQHDQHALLRSEGQRDLGAAKTLTAR